MGKPRWIVVLLAGGGLAQAALGLFFVPETVVPAGFVLGFLSQGVKICVDSTLQESVDDDYRGRVFSFYDTSFNVSFVVALLVAALVLPASGMSDPVLATVGLGYLGTAAAYARISR
jgi:hypothetical protein